MQGRQQPDVGNIIEQWCMWLCSLDSLVQRADQTEPHTRLRKNIWRYHSQVSLWFMVSVFILVYTALLLNIFSFFNSRFVTMECIVANVDNMRFDIEVALDEQYGALPLPFTGMDKSIAAVCQFYPRGTCVKGASCPFRHVRGDRTIVCKHWLRGLCKKGDQCEFLHEYDMTKMPECYFYSRFNACHNKECPFLHIDPETKVRDCPWYDRGFCRHGPLCRHRHVRRVLCMAYLAGFCPEGSNCKFMHPRFELPAVQDMQPKEGKKVMITCHFCGEGGHKAIYCNKMPPDVREAQVRQEIENNAHTSHHHMNMHNGPPQPRGPQKPLEEVTCYKCGQKGHYANKCPKGHLAFLSHAGGGGGGQNPNYRR